MKSTFLATANIALVKYWGKRDERLNLPTNGSISATMDEQLKTVTTVAFSEKLKEDEAWLDGKKAEGKELQRISEHLDLLRHPAKVSWKAKVVSENAFPAAAGFASSASGYAALTLAAAKALGLKLDTAQLSMMARRGSGSACRSLYGGFVEWQRGEKHDGSDSFALQLAPASHWKEFRNVIATVKKERKKVSSRQGMQRTVRTSRLFLKRLDEVPKTLQEVKETIREKDGAKLFAAVMRDSNNMHACMLDSRPPIIYLNDTSRTVMESVEALNDAAGEIAAGYSFDAGPNAHVFTEERHAEAVRKMLAEIEGVEGVQVCRLGEGPRELKKHLF